MATIVNALDNRFSSYIKNTHTSKAAILVIFPGHYPTIGLDVKKEGANVTDVKWHYHDLTELNSAGFSVTTVLDEATVAFPDNVGSVVMSSADPMFSIRSFRNYVNNSQQVMTSITIHSDNPAAYNGSLRLQKTNPYNRPQEIPVELDRFFDTSQYQDNKIDIDLSGNEIIASNDFLMTLVIPPGASIGLTLRFAADSAI
ncbi:MAG: hypothetical protein LBI60_00635 [Bacteroidales bacterium]|nr:hypothetical protein [Bacteroidales bacterium]